MFDSIASIVSLKNDTKQLFSIEIPMDTMELLELRQRYGQNGVATSSIGDHQVIAMSKGSISISSSNGNLVTITSNSNIICLFRGVEYRSFQRLLIRFENGEFVISSNNTVSPEVSEENGWVPTTITMIVVGLTFLLMMKVL